MDGCFLTVPLSGGEGGAPRFASSSLFSSGPRLTLVIPQRLDFLIAEVILRAGRFAVLMVSEVSSHCGTEGKEEKTGETETGAKAGRSQGRMWLHGHALQCSTPSSEALLPPDDVIAL